MGKGVAQQFGLPKKLQRVFITVEAFLILNSFEKKGGNKNKENVASWLGFINCK